MNKRYLVFFVLLACLTGCVPVDSLNPLYTDKDVVFDESLLGTWIGKDNGAEGDLAISTLVEANGKKSYVLTMTDKDGDDGHCKSVTTYHAHLVNLGGRRFLDVVPDTDTKSETYSLQIKPGKGDMVIEPRLLKLGNAVYLEFESATPNTGNGRVNAHARRAHWFLKVIKGDNKLQLDWADDDAFKKAVEKGSIHLASSLLGEGKDKDVVITASTQELQKFVVDHADDGAFFTDHMEELHRKP